MCRKSWRRCRLVVLIKMKDGRLGKIGRVSDWKDGAPAFHCLVASSEGCFHRRWVIDLADSSGLLLLQVCLQEGAGRVALARWWLFMTIHENAPCCRTRTLPLCKSAPVSVCCSGQAAMLEWLHVM